MRRFLCFLAVTISLIAMTDDHLFEPMEKVKYSAKQSFVFRFTLTDKQGCGYSIEQPQRFLSRRAIERRQRQGLSIDSTDLPLNLEYVSAFNTKYSQVVGTSRWHNSVLVAMADSSIVSTLRYFAFVKGCQLVWEAPDSIEKPNYSIAYREAFNDWDSVKTSRYGIADHQIAVMSGQTLHKRNCEGQGIEIAVLDGGFRNADRIPAFAEVNIAGARDFVYPRSKSIYKETDHGTKVLSAMAMNRPYIYIGTAPQASYWLLRCEDQQTEQPIEEDYWAMAAEFADSVGVDVINSSLGYNEFDNPRQNHKYWEMDGHTAFISQSASMLADKGIILVCSAGNSGMAPWKKITFPADADNILTVGATTELMGNAPFSGVGPTQDGRVKPDVVAIGSATALISGRGTVVHDIGTSFSTPLVSGLVACLWQSLPNKTAKEIIDIVRRSGNNVSHPDNVFGYGVPDFRKAYVLGREK